MKKRILALVCCLGLLLQLTALPAEAAGDVYFVAAGENILPVSDETMPFWNNGFLYIASSTFSGMARESLGVSQNYNSSKNLVILYNSSGMSLRFEIGKSYALDRNDTTYTPGAILKGGTVFVPVSMVAKFFGLQYSVIDVARGQLVWVRQPGHILTDRVFADAASSPMENRYAEYLKNRAESHGTQSSLGTEEGKEIEGKSIYLCLKANERTPALLDTLERYNAQAAFFCTVEFLEQQGALLRRMAVSGQTVGIFVDVNGDQTVEEQLTAGNAALERATCGKTRLVMMENAGPEQKAAAEDAGYKCLEPDLDRSGYGLHTLSEAINLLRRISSRRGDVTVWLGDTANDAGLRNVLHTTDSVDGSCLALTETA